jgi:hypothetical protein
LLAGALILGACGGAGVEAYRYIWGGNDTVPASMKHLTEVPTAGNAAAGLAPQTSAQASVRASAAVRNTRAAAADDAYAAALANPDEAKRKEFIASLHAQADADPRTLGADLSRGGPSLVTAGYYDDAYDLSTAVITQRATEPNSIMGAQRVRVLALIAHANAQNPSNPADWAHALGEAKGYYNAASLANSAEAANLLAEVLAVSVSKEAATTFLAQQRAVISTSTANPPSSAPLTILQSIKANKTQWDVALKSLQARVTPGRTASYTNLMSQGEYYLLEDRPDDARKCFEGAVGLATTKTRMVREALEAVARSIRAQDGSVSNANAFIQSLQKDPEIDGLALIDGGQAPPAPADLQTAAKAIKLANMSKLDASPAPTK